MGPRAKRRFTGLRLASSRGTRLYPLAAALAVVWAGALHPVGVPAKPLVAIVLLLAIVYTALLWGRWPGIIASIASVILFDYFFGHPPGAFSRPTPRESVVLVGFVAAALVGRGLFHRMREGAHTFVRSERLQRMVLQNGAAIGFVVMLADVLQAFGLPRSRVVTIGPFALIVVLIALLWGRGPATNAALASVIVILVGYLPPRRFSMPPLGDGLLLLGLIASGALVGTLADRMRDARQRAQEMAESEQLQRTLLRLISHDLKTPLTTIMGSLHTVLDKSLDLEEETRRELLAIAYDQSTRLNRLVTGVLEMTRLEAGTVRPRREPCELAEVVQTALGQLRETLRGRQYAIFISSSLPEIPVDSVLLSHAVANLLDNAAKYSPSGFPIEVNAIQSGRNIIVSIADRGPGIPAAALERVFKKFFGLREASVQPNTSGGVGLGLAVARGIVEAHGGRMWAEQRKGGGTIVRMSLPLN